MRVSKLAPWRAIPALFTKISNGGLLSIISLVALILVTSIGQAVASQPREVIWLCNSSRLSLERAASVTEAPASHNATAHPTPIPDEAPATNARFPANLKEGVRGSDVSMLQAPIILPLRHNRHFDPHIALLEHCIVLHVQQTPPKCTI
ncbi:MAG: Uncharacterised protein [SAR116 cluster bacterium]|nr:MAG: Uncharacterised protein [SAR116 cluster bacterium]